MSIQQLILDMGAKAQQASRELIKLSSEKKNSILQAMANGLRQHSAAIIAANAKDIAAAKATGTSAALIDRLMLNEARIEAMAKGFEHVCTLKDPIGDILSEIKKDNNLLIQKRRVPIGVIGIIYESRPNVTADVASLCLKTSNAVILRGGADAFHSNQAINKALLESGLVAGLPENAIQLVATTDRAAVKELVQMAQYVDLVIPRGGEGLINTVVELATVPIIKHYKGLCHVYVDESADINTATNICENAKCQRPGVCNAIETLLVHQNIAADFLPKLADVLQKNNVELRGDAATKTILPDIQSATDADWDSEYLDLILAIKIVPDLSGAIAHINTHGSHHSDAIISNNSEAQTQFCTEVDSATVYVNASTRFTDGAEFGMGAEIGISTDKLHARGPMGLEELTSYKYVVLGNGQIRE